MQKKPMPYNPNIHHRRSIRLKGYDYSQAGLYFVTICCHNRMHLFGNVVNGGMELNDAGKIADACWMEIPNHFPNAVLHEYIVMPNHVHGIVELKTDINVVFVGAENFSSPTKTTETKRISKNDSPFNWIYCQRV